MSFVRVPSAAVEGQTAHPVTTEVLVSRGLPAFVRDGAPEVATRETRDRIRAAVLNAGFMWPDRRIDVCLTPTQERWPGAILDLPIALGVLAASGQLGYQPEEESHEPPTLVGAIGELSLYGLTRPIGAVEAMSAVIESDLLLVPAGQAPAAQPGSRAKVYEAYSLAYAAGIAAGRLSLPSDLWGRQ